MNRTNKPVASDQVKLVRDAKQSMIQDQQTPRPSLRSQPRLASSLRHTTVPTASPPRDEVEAESPKDTAVTSPEDTFVDSPASNKTITGPDWLRNAKAKPSTPSYPFPRTSSTTDRSEPYPSPQHQPFTTLSPTGSPAFDYADHHVRDRKQSSAGTPHTFIPFRPRDGHEDSPQQNTQDQPLYQSPSLYDLVLKLHSEPRLSAWWRNLAEILRDEYYIQKAVLAVPVDPTDIENVPWAQKAAYDSSGLIGPAKTNEREATETGPAVKTPVSQHPNHRVGSRGSSARGPKQTLRPMLGSRHSFAGYETTRVEQATFHDYPLQSLQRAAMASPSITEKSQESAALGNSPDIKQWSDDLSQGEDSSMVLFSTLRPLKDDSEPIVESAHVNRVLTTNKSLILTRSYATEAVLSNEPVRPSRTQTYNHDQLRSDVGSAEQTASGVSQTPNNSFFGRWGVLRRPTYEEVEQIPPSPWAHSPAPSPAIQAEPEENPFFNPNVEQQSFQPDKQSLDYSKVGVVEAIGVDHANTVIHIPLQHPVFSAHMSDMNGTSASKAPIAILSVQSKIVPYPQSLLDSLKHMGAHMATSFHNGCQLEKLSNTTTYARRSAFFTQKSSYMATKRSDRPSSPRTPSMTSPSRSSIHSKQSSAGSTAESPLPGNRGRGSSVGGSFPSPNIRESGSYFGDFPPLGSSLQGKDEAQSMGEAIDHAYHQPSVGSISKENKQTVEPPTKPSQTNEQRSTVSRRHGHSRKNTFIHSDGADFGTSFQTLPATTFPEHDQPSSLREDFQLPPPSERLLRLITDAMPVQIFLCQPNTGNLKWFNGKFLVYRGQSRREILENPHAAIHPEDLKGYKSAWKTSLSSGHQFQRQVRLKRFDQQYQWYYIRAVPLRDRGQNIVHWLGTAVDIHDHHLSEVRARTQEAKAVSNAKYRLLADSSPQITFTATEGKGITFCNNTWITYSGQTKDEALGNGFMEHVHKDDIRKCQFPKNDNSQKGGANVPISIGSKTRRRIIRNSSGTSSDSSAEEESFTMAGFPATSPADLPQRKLSELAHSGIMKVNRDALGKIYYSTEVRLRNRENKFRWHMVRVVLADSEAGERTWYGSCSDINDHKELELQMKETMDAKSRFLSNMSHEMRTPLNGIENMANLLLSSNPSQEQMEHVVVIKQSTENLLNLINDILDLSKAEAGMITLSMEPFHVRSLIEEVNDLTATMAMKKGVELNFLVEETAPLAVIGDRFRIRQVLLNIVNNAVKFTYDGEIFVKCELIEEDPPVSPLRLESGEKAWESSIKLQISCLDTGKGFTEQDREKLFQRFSQIDGSSTRQQGGTGLGLAISKHLVELHGGTMNAHGELGKGSTFTFTLKGGATNVSTHSSLSSTASWHPPDSEPIKDVPLSAGRATFGGTMTGEQLHDSPGSVNSLPTTQSASTGQSISSAGSSATQGSSTSVSLAPPAKHTASKSIDSVPSDLIVHASQLESTRVKSTTKPYVVLIHCPLPWTTEATAHHVKTTLTAEIPYTLVTKSLLTETHELLTGHQLVFSHILLNNPNTQALVEIMEKISGLAQLARTYVIVICTNEQKDEALGLLSQNTFKRFTERQRLVFVKKPLKPSKLSPFFDPLQSREISLDHNRQSTQNVAEMQRKMMDDIKRQLGNRDIRILVVEDNEVNVQVITRFFGKVAINADVATDGIECTNMVFDRAHNHYSLVLCDLQMPNKDGLQTCREIREWEKENNHSPMPMVALSANVLGEVSQNCYDAGFNRYLTKPLHYGNLAKVMMELLLK